MCIPCVAAAPELGWVLLIPLFIIVGLLYGLARILPVVGLALVPLHRFATGAVIRKPIGESDTAFYARTGKSRKVRRYVRFTANWAGLAALVLAAASPLVFSAVAFTLGGTIAAAGVAAERRNRNTLTTGPTRVRAQIGDK